MEALFKAVYDRKLTKGRDNWFVQPGTVLRCDVDSDGNTVASAIFASIPQVQVDSFIRTRSTKFRKGICTPRKLHEVFNPYDASSERDQNQLFRKKEGAATDEILWICETWLLIVDSGTFFRYCVTHDSCKKSNTLMCSYQAMFSLMVTPVKGTFSKKTSILGSSSSRPRTRKLSMLQLPRIHSFKFQ